jgi:glycosyltransferase involved in cell wall biosynthesis
MTLRILVDGRVMQDRYHGIGRYAFELLRELSGKEPSGKEPSGKEPSGKAGEVKLTMLYRPEGGGRLDVAELAARGTVRAVASEVPVASVRSQPLLARAVRRFQPDVVFIPYHLSTPVWHGRVPVVTVIHDCVFERAAAVGPAGPAGAAGAGSRAFSVAYRVATRLAARSATTLAVPSEAARQDLRRFYGIELPAGAIVPHGVGAQFFPPPGGGRPRPRGLDLPERYVLHVGTQRPHKNQRVLVQALAELRTTRPGLGLVLVGQPDTRFPDEVGDLVRNLRLDGQVRRYAHLDDAMLLGVYANADVFAYPSLVEGFGMPVLEAMAAGLPVLASDAEAVREVADGAAVIVPARSPGAWARALDRVLGDPRLAQDLRVRAQAVAARHTWSRSAERTLALLTSAARRGPVPEAPRGDTRV